MMEYPHQPKEQLGPVGAGIIFVVMLVILFGFSQCSSEPRVSHRGYASEFPGPWQNVHWVMAPGEIGVGLGRSRANCARHAYYRIHARNRRWARVVCSSDGENWSHWGVRWDRPGGPAAFGPLRPDRDLPLPVLPDHVSPTAEERPAEPGSS